LAKHPRYEIIRLIGKGGMGDMYEARRRMMERTVALKIINRDLVRKPEAADRFHAECPALEQRRLVRSIGLVAYWTRVARAGGSGKESGITDPNMSLARENSQPNQKRLPKQCLRSRNWMILA
jgi:serine/threonine protein kinase